MGEINWNTPPTEDELNKVNDESSSLDWNTPPTEDEEGIIKENKDENPTQDNKYIRLTDEELYEEPSVRGMITDTATEAGLEAGGTLLKTVEPAVKGITNTFGLVFPSFESTVENAYEESIKWYGKEIADIKKMKQVKYGSENWGIGEYGSLAPDIITSGAKYTTTLGQGLMEFGLSAGRNELWRSEGIPWFDKLKIVSLDVATAVIGTRIMNKYLPKNQVEEIGDMVSSISDVPTQNKIQGAVDVMNEAGIDELNFSAKDKIVSDIIEGKILDDIELSDAIMTKVNRAFKSSETNINKLYAEAGDIGKSVKIEDDYIISQSFGDWMDSVDFNNVANRDIFETDDALAVLEAFESKIAVIDFKDVHSLELLRKKYSGLSSIHSGERKYAEGKIASFLESQVDSIMKKSNMSNPYVKPREEYVNHLNTFKKKGKESFGTTIEKVMTDTPEYDAAKEILTSNIKPNLASKFIKNISNDMKIRTSIVTDSIMTNIPRDTKEIGLEEVSIMISNFDKIDKRGLNIMLGEQGAKQLKNQIEALAMIDQAIKVATEKDKSIIKDVLNLGAAAAAAKISPYASVHVSINSAKNIFDKTLSGKDQKKTVLKTIMKKIYGVKNAELKRRLSKAVVRALGLSYTHHESTLPKKEELIKVKE